MGEAMVGLADAIEALRSELMSAASGGDGQAMRFSLDPVELTVQVAVTRDAEGKIGWSIFGAGGGYERASTQTLTVKLTPLWLREDGSLTPDFAIASPASAEDTIGRDED
jgi:hypothetical protein